LNDYYIFKIKPNKTLEQYLKFRFEILYGVPPHGYQAKEIV